MHPRFEQPADRTGHWWRPDGKNEQVPGYLYEPGGDAGLRLILNTRLAETWDPGFLEDMPMLLGQTATFRPMTLVRCRAVRSGIGFREFEPELIVDGGHLVPDQQLLVRSLSCRYSGLEQWAADLTKFRSTAQLPFETPKSATAELATGETISVQFSVDGPRQMDHESGKGGATLGWKLNAWLSVRAPDERPHAGMLRLLDRLGTSSHSAMVNR